MSAALIVTIGIFAVGLVIGFFKWLHAIVVSLKEMIAKIDERTGWMIGRMDKIERTMNTIANAEARMDSMENDISDHEGRLRKIEQSYH